MGHGEVSFTPTSNCRSLCPHHPHVLFQCLVLHAKFNHKPPRTAPSHPGGLVGGSGCPRQDSQVTDTVLLAAVGGRWSGAREVSVSRPNIPGLTSFLRWSHGGSASPSLNPGAAPPRGRYVNCITNDFALNNAFYVFVKFTA